MPEKNNELLNEYGEKIAPKPQNTAPQAPKPQPPKANNQVKQGFFGKRPSAPKKDKPAIEVTAEPAVKETAPQPPKPKRRPSPEKGAAPQKKTPVPAAEKPAKNTKPKAEVLTDIVTEKIGRAHV